ncbi:MAG: PEP-utilizing enzyme [Treponema sp.]|nr:PEP-utilizing enzyme [Treponema sp.]
MIKAFRNIQQSELPLCGGKGTSLVKMINSKYKVPDGFIIGSDVFMAYCQSNDIINTPLDQFSQAIIDGAFSNEIKDNILSTFYQVFSKNTKVAVRSSALCEDGKKFAWSGELETYLFVEEKDLLSCVKKCFASLFSERALTYARKVNVNKEHLQVAVIVQEQLDSDFAGVAFSCNPLSGVNEVVLEYVTGQGEALVSGRVIPNRIIYSNDNLIAKEDNVYSSQNISIELQQNLVKGTKRLERLYGFPVDVEWAIEKGRLFYLQCRPVTSYSHRGSIDALLPELFPITKWKFDTQTQFHYMFMHAMMRAANEQLHKRVFGFSRTFEDCVRTKGEVFKDKSASDRLKTCMNSMIEKETFFLERFASLWAKVVKREKRYIKRITDLNFSVLSDNDLLTEAKKFEEEYRRSLVFAFYFIDDFLEEKFLQLLQNEYSLTTEESTHVFSKIATCSNEYGTLFYSEEPVDLLKIAIKKENGENIQKDIDLHINKYGWMLAPIERTIRIFTPKDYESRIDSLINEDNLSERLCKVLNVRKENDKQFNDTINKYHIKGQALHFAKIIRTFIYYHTLLTEHTDLLCYHGTKTILTEIACRKRVPVEDIVMLSTEEIISFMASKITSEEVQALAENRSKSYALIFHKGKLYVFDDEEADRFQKSFVPTFVENHKSSIKNKGSDSDNILLKGSVCQVGRVIGRVKIVNSYSDCEKVDPGDILVANMTTPNFISAMERAAGFITDQGGITCHAAILSRELGVPCIVGTAIATKILRDNQIVELDAYIGVVKAKQQ